MASDTAITSICRWGKAFKPCQFSDQVDYAPETHEFCGRHYCAVHAPLDDPKGWDHGALSGFLSLQTKQGRTDFSGVVFRGQKGKTYEFDGKHRKQLTDCQFVDGVALTFNCPVDMSGATAMGELTIDLKSTELVMRDGYFAGKVYLYAGTRLGTRVGLRNSVFKSILRVRLDQALDAFDASKCDFAFAPEIQEKPGLPQRTSFDGAVFQRKSAFGQGAEANFRVIRNLFHANRDREQEGLFFAYEKRARRKALGLLPGAWLPRSLSALYDWAADYGQKFERALWCLLAVQVLFCVLYSWWLGGWSAGWHFEPDVITFTFAQVLKPFELLSARGPDRWPYTEILTSDYKGWWTLATVMHSVISLSLVALFLLALRWRFRRD